MSRKLLITGSTGFLGRHLLPVLRQTYRSDEIVGVSSKDYNLMDQEQVKQMFQDHRPDIIIHLAAYSGGIGINKAYPADFYFRNTILTALMFQEAAKHGIEKLVYPMGGCSYPATATSPIDEQQMWNGLPQFESIGYSAAKKMGIIAGVVYRAQSNLRSSIVIPGNMYGEYDNYKFSESHVIPATIRRIYEAKKDGLKEIVMWGTGEPVRDFVYAGDVAKCFPYFIDHYDSTEPVNISSGTSTTMRGLVELVCDIMGYNGNVVWDTTKPNGQMVKIFDVSRLNSLGLSCKTSLKDGLSQTIKWFSAQYENCSDGLRL
jgi:GDP-L-fucose synthase